MGFMTYTFKLNPMTVDSAVLRAIHFVNESLRAHDEAEALKIEIGKTFAKVLECAGVYKNEEDFMKFIAVL